MATTVVYGNTDGKLMSNNAVYSDSRAGVGATLATNELTAGQDGSGPYYVAESFVAFDTSAIVDTDVISSAVLSLWALWPPGGAAWTLRARIRDYGATLEVGDFVPGADLGALTLVAHIDSPFTAGQYYNLLDDALPANINKAGSTRIVLASSKTESGTASAGAEYEHFASSAHSGTSTDPKLTITHSAPSGNDPVGMLGFFGA